MAGILQALMVAGSGRRTTWNPLDKAAGITLTNGNLTASQTVSGGNQNVRCTVSKTTGKWHVEWTVVSVDSSLNPCPVICNASASLTTGTIGANTNSIIWFRDGSVKFNNGGVGSADTYTTSDVLAIEIDISTLDFYCEKLGGTGRKGPFSFVGMTGALFAMSAFAGSGAPAQLIGNFGASAFGITPTSGYLPWNAG